MAAVSSLLAFSNCSSQATKKQRFASLTNLKGCYLPQSNLNHDICAVILYRGVAPDYVIHSIFGETLL